MAIDRYNRVADNVAAIAATIEAMRPIERHGGAAILDRAFTGFTAIESDAKPWHVVLGVDTNSTHEYVRLAYRRARALFHPDKDNGSAIAFDNVQEVGPLSAWSAASMIDMTLKLVRRAAA